VQILAVANRYPPWSIGGYEAIAAGSVQALRGAGHGVRVLTTVPDPSDRTVSSRGDADVHRELRWYWREHEFPRFGWRETVELERANAAVLARHLEDLEPDAVIWWAMGGMSLSLLEQVRRAGLPAVGVVGDDWMTYAPAVDSWTRRFAGWRRPAAPAAERLAGVPATVDLVEAARWVFISEHVRSRALGLGLDGLTGAVVHPGVDPHRFAARAPNRWGWRLLYCGRIDPRKGISTAVEALRSLPPQATLTIDGDGDRRHVAELASLARRLGLADRVHFTCSPRAEVPEAYAAADALVFPVRWEEPWGLVPLEAMATGRPVVASRAGGGAAEYLRDGQNCIQFPPGDAPALAQALVRLQRDRELRGRLTAAGLETAGRFTERRFHETVKRELEQTVREATGQPRQPGPDRS
jgi:glycosyltransferase involved in cell wall biosynthesis